MTLLGKNLLFTLAVPGTVAIYLPLILSGDRPPAGGVPLAAGALLLALGAMLYGWSLWGFGRAGRGTPLPLDPPQFLVARGPYRHTRNPMYLAVLSAILGWALVFGSAGLLLYFGGIAAAFHAFVTRYEEPDLTRRFGQGYRDYRDTVPRWLPRLRTGGRRPTAPVPPQPEDQEARK